MASCHYYSWFDPSHSFLPQTNSCFQKAYFANNIIKLLDFYSTYIERRFLTRDGCFNLHSAIYDYCPSRVLSFIGYIDFLNGTNFEIAVILLAVPISLLMLSSLNYETTFNENWRAAANYVKSEQDNSTVVFLSPQFQHRSFTYYYQRSFYENYDSTFYLMNKRNVFFENSTPIESLLGDSSYNKMLFVIVSKAPELNTNLIKATSQADVRDLKKLNDIYIYKIGQF